MERRQLEYVVAVAEAGSISRAAERLHVAQPGVSAQLALLERELGERVFDRDRRGVRPTAVGEQVVDRARRALAAFDDIRTVVAEARGEVRGAVTVGTVRGVPLGDLTGALGAVHRDHPGVTLTLVEAESADLLAAITAGEVHLALVGLPGVPPAGVRTRTVLRDRLAVAVAPGHRWHGRRRVTLADLDGAAVVALPAGTGNRDAFEAAARRARIDPDVRFEAGTVAGVLDLARAGLGAAVVPTAALTSGMADGLHAVTLTPAVTSRLALAWADPRTRTPSPATRALLAATLADPVKRSRNV